MKPRHFQLSLVLSVALPALLLLVAGPVGAQEGLKIDKTMVATLDGLDAASLIGLRVVEGRVLVADALGHTVSLSSDQSSFRHAPPAPGPILDFAVRFGAPVFLTAAGNLAGNVDPAWPRGPFAACSLEIADDGALLLEGGHEALYLSPAGSAPARLPGLFPAIPLADGFLWTLSRHPVLRTWQALLLDNLGNRMQRVCRFSAQFQPEGLWLGPTGPEKELLVSSFAEGSRWLSLVGQNGRMLWRIPAPDPLCRRDLAWAPNGDLLVLERVDGRICLRRWAFQAPEG
ncbi:MAG: hypothetical protein GX442_03400 [Candidatus Riflebacteria bacterium]|nr:hypothetical protein [Candidatus Riflebacteria bacterium]